MCARRIILICSIGAITLAGCGGPTVASPSVASPTTDPSAFASAEDVTLPAADAFVPDGIAGATDWIPMERPPEDFDADLAHPSTLELADAFGAALHAARAANPERPVLDLDTFVESESRAVLIISETGIGDDSVFGNQYALVVRHGTDGWTLDELWTRALCSRAVSEQLCV